jgi:HK97 gp10 family phage protein
MNDTNKVFQIIEQKIRHAIENTLEKTAQYTESKLSELFKTEGASLNVEWSPLKEAYLKQKIKKGYSEKKLHKTTTLAQSFTSIVKPFSAVVGTPVEYAKYHEYGTRKMPARPFMKPVFDHLVSKRVWVEFFREGMHAD